jgi:hypothetical protein
MVEFVDIVPNHNGVASIGSPLIANDEVFSIG